VTIATTNRICIQPASFKKYLPIISTHKMSLKGKWQWPHKQWMGPLLWSWVLGPGLASATDPMLSWGFFHGS